MSEQSPLAQWKNDETLIGELDRNAHLFEYWVQTGQLTANQDGLYNYDIFLQLRAELHSDSLSGQARTVRFDNIEPPPSIAFNFIEGQIVFWLHNHGVLVVAGNERRKLNPKESIKLLNFLYEHRNKFDIIH